MATHISCSKLLNAEDQVEESERFRALFRSSLFFRFWDVLVNSMLPFLHMGLILCYRTFFLFMENKKMVLSVAIPVLRYILVK